MLEKIKEVSDINLKNIEPYDSSGFMSKIFSANSDKGKVIMHIINPTEEQRRQKVHLKTKYLLKLLAETEIPTAKIYETGEVGGNYYMIQECLEGQQLGKRMLKEGKIVDVYDFEGYENKIRELVFKFNEIEIGGYGWLFGDETRYDSWREFLEKESEIWLKKIRENNYDVPDLSHIQNLLDENSDLLSCKPNLVHGDLLNPSNILVKDGKITGVLDFEWTLSGDPSWDYAFTHNELISEEFSKKIRLYKIFWNLWGAGMHVGDELFEPLYKRFQKAMQDF